MDNSSKQRLIGVMVLVALATIVLPIAFHQSSTQNIALSIPENAPPPPPLSDVQIAPPTHNTPITQKAAFQSTTDRVDLNTSTSKPTDTAMGSNNVKAASEHTQPSPLAKSAYTPTATTTKPNKPTSVMSTATTKQTRSRQVETIKTTPVSFPAWDIQLGSFSDQKNAQHLIATLRKNGFNAYSKTVPLSHNKTITKVFIGPEVNRSQAEAIVKQLHVKHQLKGFIVKHTL